MPVTQNVAAPYAPTSVILSLIDRYRQKGLPTPVTADVLARAGISESLISRSLQALQVLDLIGEDGRPTSVMEGLRLAPEAEFKPRMADWLNAAYADAISFVDPATASETEVRDAFRGYKPLGQQERMVSLFLGLFEAAGVAPERKRKSSSSKPQNGASAPRPARQVRIPDQVAAKAQTPVQHPVRRDHAISGLPPALSGLLTSLPQQGETWDQAEHDRFLRTFEAVLDFCYPVTAGTRQRVVSTDEEDTE
jgi:hypothetical protein